MHLSRIFSYACTLISLLCVSANSVAQDRKMVENALTEADTIQLFRGLSASYNLSGSIMRMVSDYGEIEAALRCNLRDKYFPIVELGLGSAKHEEDAVTGIVAKTNAPFVRLGCDFNISKNKHDDYRVFAGARYGFTSFHQEISGNITDPYWGGEVAYSIPEHTFNYHWAELVFGVDGKLWGPIRIGWSARYKLKLSGKDSETEKMWYIPGFGKSGNVLGGVFYISVELQRKNKKIQ